MRLKHSQDEQGAEEVSLQAGKAGENAYSTRKLNSLRLVWSRPFGLRLTFSACAASLLAIAAFSAQAASPRLTFSKSFPGSLPPWEEITVDKSGAGQYKDDPKDEDPVKFQLTEAEAGEMFGLADRLDHFSHSLESKLKVAKMGLKTFRYEADASDPTKATEVKFNYTEDLDGKALADWFERIAESERSLIKLETAVRFDKLGVQDAILRIEVIRDQKQLIAPEQFLPMLDRVAKNESFLHMARERAAALAESIRALPK